MTSLYATLGLRRNATAETIKAAYRRLVKSAHPDAGGDRARFEHLTLAYDVLSDPDRRTRYDETGETDAAPDNDHVEILKVIEAVFDQMLMDDQEPKRHHVLDALQQHFAKQEAELTKRIAVFERAKQRVTDLADRFTTLDGSANLMAAMARRRAFRADQAIAETRKTLALVGRVRAYLKRYTFRPEVEPQSVTLHGLGAGMFCGSTTGATTNYTMRP